MKYLFLLYLPFFFLLVNYADAYEQIVVDQENQAEVFAIDNPAIKTFYYGELFDYPHAYEFVVTKPMKLAIQIFEPKSKEAENIHSGIIVRRKDNGRGVEEIARLPAQDTKWSDYYEAQSGDRYVAGPSFEQEIKPGIYKFEVSTPINKGKYIMQIGTATSHEYSKYFSKLKQVYQVKRFLGKTPLAMFSSRLVYIPILIFIFFFIIFKLYKRYYVS